MESLMLEYCTGIYVPKDLCIFDHLGEIEDVKPCHPKCKRNCSTCAVQKVFNTLALYEYVQTQLLKMRSVIEPDAKYSGRTVLALMDLAQIKEETTWNDFLHQEWK